MPRWIRIASLTDCPPGVALERVADDRVVALFNVEGQLHALDGVCPHQGGPLGQGELTGCIVTCPWHGWQFDVGSGRNQITPTIEQARLPVKIEEGEILVEIEDEN